MRNKLSVVVLTQNEEENIVDCLESVRFADELIVVDDNSEDRTVELSKKFTNKVVIHTLNNNFSNQRNWALNLVHNEWVLFIDADERVSDELKHEISKAIENKEFNGFYLKRIDRIWGTTIKHGEGGSVELLRLARLKSGKWKGKVHEEWKVSGKTSTLDNHLIHIPHNTVKSFLNDIDHYSTLRSQELFEEGKNTNVLEIIAFPSIKFVLNYIVKQGYKDGIAGLLYAVMMSMHSFFVRAKLYQLRNKK